MIAVALYRHWLVLDILLGLVAAGAWGLVFAVGWTLIPRPPKPAPPARKALSAAPVRRALPAGVRGALPAAPDPSA